MSEMGSRIRQKRLENGMTMEQLANAIGVKASAINKYEKGIVENIKRSTIKDMAVVLDCDPAWLMGFDAPKPGEMVVFSPYADNDVFDGKAISTKTYDREPTKEELNFLFLLSQLNDDGLNEALKRIEELTQLDKYKKV